MNELYDLLNDGTIEYKDEFGQYHNEFGPAVIYNDGTKYWYTRGVIDRPGGLPAIEFSDGGVEYYVDGVISRLDGPAIICSDGEEIYVINGVTSRPNTPTDSGPAWIHPNENDMYIVDGKHMTKDQYYG